MQVGTDTEDEALASWTATKRRERRGALAMGLSLLGLLLGLVLWILGPPPVPEPQGGRVLPGEVLVAWNPATRIRAFGLEALHPFDIGKMDKMARHLVKEGLLDWSDLAVGPEASREQLRSVHTQAMLDGLHDPATLSAAIEVRVPRFLSERTIDQRIMRPFRLGAGGTLVAAAHAARGGLGINLAGGYHHARPDLAHGFCLYNDVAIAVGELRRQGFDGHVLIVDTDAHQGDGNHAAFAGDDRVTTFSMHQGSLFPEPKVPGDRDLSLPAGTGDDTFLAVLDGALEELMAGARPALVVHVAGADVLADDPLAGLSLSPEGLKRRDLLVQQRASEAGAGLLYVLGGGYGPSAASAQGASIASMIRAAAAGA